MEYLNKLYSNEFFGIGLFIVITILAFSFLVILFFGKKDEKARIEKENEIEKDVKVEAIEPETNVVSENLETISLEPETPAVENEPTLEQEHTIEFTPLTSNVEEPKEEELEVFEEKKMEDLDPFVTSNLVLNTDYINEEQPVLNTDSIPTVEEDTSIDEVLSKYDAIEEQTLEPEITPVIEEEPVESIFTEPVSEEKPAAPFSSVYLEKEEPTKEEPVEVEKPKSMAFELPKRVDLPKRNESATHDNIISSMNKQE